MQLLYEVVCVVCGGEAGGRDLRNSALRVASELVKTWHEDILQIRMFLLALQLRSLVPTPLVDLPIRQFGHCSEFLDLLRAERAFVFQELALEQLVLLPRFPVVVMFRIAHFCLSLP